MCFNTNSPSYYNRKALLNSWQNSIIYDILQANITQRQIIMTKVKPKSVHFIGLCGVGMSAVARLYQLMGWKVTGSDQGVYDPVKSYLEKCGLICQTPHQAEHIPENPDLIVIGRHAKLTIEKCVEVKVAL